MWLRPLSTPITPAQRGQPVGQRAQVQPGPDLACGSAAASARCGRSASLPCGRRAEKPLRDEPLAHRQPVRFGPLLVVARGAMHQRHAGFARGKRVGRLALRVGGADAKTCRFAGGVRAHGVAQRLPHTARASAARRGCAAMGTATSATQRVGARSWSRRSGWPGIALAAGRQCASQATRADLVRPCRSITACVGLDAAQQGQHAASMRCQRLGVWPSKRSTSTGVVLLARIRPKPSGQSTRRPSMVLTAAGAQIGQAPPACATTRCGSPSAQAR
jgi:hypothetical protein